MPLPQGCKADDCKTMIAVYDILNTSVAGGNYGLSPLYGFGVSMDSSRQATVYQKYTTGGRIHSAMGSYIVIGQKQQNTYDIPQYKF